MNCINRVFSCPQDRSIGDLVTNSLTHWLQDIFEKYYYTALQETCDNDNDKYKYKDNYKDKDNDI